jgi:hypothetical protein
MAVAFHISGMDEVLRRLNKEIGEIKGCTRSGMRQSALLVKRRSVQRTPVDTGNLRNSAYTEVHDTLRGPGAVIGYTAAYAPYVHEVTHSKRGRPIVHRAGQVKFLESAIKESVGDILRILRERARVR